MQNPSDGKSALGLDPNVAAGLCYLPLCAISLIMSIIVLVTDKTNKLPRFHAMQSLLLHGVAVVGWIVCIIIIFAITMMAAAMNMPSLSFLAVLVWAVFLLGLLAAIVISCIKAFMGQMFKLPLIGNMADSWSN